MVHVGPAEDDPWCHSIGLCNTVHTMIVCPLALKVLETSVRSTHNSSPGSFGAALQYTILVYLQNANAKFQIHKVASVDTLPR